MVKPAVCLLLALVAAGSAAAQTRPPGQQQAGPSRIGNFQEWTAASYQEGGQKICYAFARASRSDPQRSGVILTVTHRPNGRDQVAMNAGYAYPRGAEVTIAVGSTELAFYTSGSNAFAREGRAAVAAFRGGAQAVARGPRASGGGTATDSFPLSGFSAAYDAISRECPAGRR